MLLSPNWHQTWRLWANWSQFLHPLNVVLRQYLQNLNIVFFFKIFKDWTFASDSYLLFGANWEVIACSVTEMVTEHVIIVIVSLALPFSSNINPKMQQHCYNLLVFFLCFCLQSSFLGIFNRMLLGRCIWFPLFFTLHTLLVPAIAQVEFNDKMKPWSIVNAESRLNFECLIHSCSDSIWRFLWVMAPVVRPKIWALYQDALLKLYLVKKNQNNK